MPENQKPTMAAVDQKPDNVVTPAVVAPHWFDEWSGSTPHITHIHKVKMSVVWRCPIHPIHSRYDEAYRGENWRICLSICFCISCVWR